MLALLLTHAAALAVWAWFTVYYETPLNVRQITGNGSADNLKAGWHQRRTWVRFWWWLACTVLGSVVAGWPGFVLSFGALGALLAGFFLRTFGPLLNHGLKLDYKSRFYASPVSASFPDAYIWRETRQHWPGQSDAGLQGRANLLNQWFLNLALLGCVLLYVALLATGCLLHRT